MRYRTAEQIYAPNLQNIPALQDVQRQCDRIINNAVDSNNMHVIAQEINGIVNPKDREYTLTIMHDMMIARSSSDSYDSVPMTQQMWESIESDFRRIQRHAQGEQVAEEMIDCEQMTPAVVTNIEDVSRLAALENDVKYLMAEMERLKQEKSVAPTTWLWPMYTAQATEEDKKVFENFLTRLCHSNKKSLSSSIKTFLKRKEDEGIIRRPAQINEEFEILQLFGYPYVEKTYYNP